MIDKPLTSISCPACHGIIVRDFKVEASFPVPVSVQMALKCPHCKNPCRVSIASEFARAIEINGQRLKTGAGEEGNGIRTLSP